MSIDKNISDLFFNTDLSTTVISDDKGNFVDFDKERLADEAIHFLGCLYRLGVSVPNADELVADFLERV